MLIWGEASDRTILLAICATNERYAIRDVYFNRNSHSCVDLIDRIITIIIKKMIVA